MLLSAAGKQDLEIAAELGISNQKAARWSKRFLQAGLTGLEKAARRPGRTPTIGAAMAKISLVESFKISNHPQFAEWREAIVGALR